MTLSEVKKLIEEAQAAAAASLNYEELTVKCTAEEELENNGELSAINGVIAISAKDAPETETELIVTACIEEDGSVDDAMFENELSLFRTAVEDYKGRFDRAEDKAQVIREIEEMIMTGIDRELDRRQEAYRKRFFRIASIIAAALMVGAAIYLLVDMLIK